MSEEATRHKTGLRYDLVPSEALEALAERFALGAERYGDNNWKKGQPGDKSPVNHLMAHIVAYQKKRARGQDFSAADEGTRESPYDDLAAILWNAAAEIYFRMHPEKYDDDDNTVREHHSGHIGWPT